MAKRTKPPRKQKQTEPTGRSAAESASVAGKRVSSFKTALKVEPPGPISINPPRPKERAPLTVARGAPSQIETIIYVHGIGNKPPASVLKCQWDSALFGVQLGDRSRMAYWVNREYYPVPSNETCAHENTIKIDDDEVTPKSTIALASKKPTDEREPIESEIKALTRNEAQRVWLRKMAEDMTRRGLLKESNIDDRVLKAANARIRFVPLDSFLMRLVTQKLTRAFLRDLNDFFFHPDRRQAMEQSLVDRLNAGGGPFIVIAHSQGSMIAYNVLRQLSQAECDVRLFLTIGSPLGLPQVKDIFRGWAPDGVLSVPGCVSRWINVSEWLDPVAANQDVGNDFSPKERIENYSELLLNPDAPLHPHSATGYLRSIPVRTAVRETAGNGFTQAVAKSIIVKDLVEGLEDSFRKERHTVLIQLATPAGRGALDQENLTDVGAKLRETIEEMVTQSGDSLEDAAIDPLKRWMSAKLTRLEIERLRTRYKDLMIEKVWRDASKKALINRSTITVQARPANLSYEALGRDIVWAILDTGICADHPHFKKHRNVARQWDCTKRGDPEEINEEESKTADKNGHGTHVAGIIAGWHKFMDKSGAPDEIFSGMAPETKLYGFKVLDDQGNGQDSYVIKALTCIADLNENAGKLVVQGVNLSLGGSFDSSVYGCGHTPVCQELRRLWGQGVLVCLAAGNEGYAVLQALGGQVPSNMDLSIGDPANLEEAIAVGSIHKSNPHTYGVSYFSSRGPTADGRKKPDLVAPGEQVLSAYHAYDKDKPEDQRTFDDLYIEMSGTSMAAPHVSGLLAAFLSVRREFIGYPNRVKRILLDNCTDLNRDVYIQGHGMPNLIKMLANS